MNALTQQAYRTAQPKPGARKNFRRQLQWFAGLVIAPRIARHLSAGTLNAQRLYAAQCLIAGWPSLWPDLPQMAKSAPSDLPFSLSALDAFRILVDQQHASQRGQRLDVAA